MIVEILLSKVKPPPTSIWDPDGHEGFAGDSTVVSGVIRKRSTGVDALKPADPSKVKPFVEMIAVSLLSASFW